MRYLSLLLALISLTTLTKHSRPAKLTQGDDAAALRKLWLLDDLRALEAESVKLGKPLGVAAAKTEIAAAAWTLDRAWAEKLLSEAYELTLPDEEERARLRDRPLGAIPKLPTNVDLARNEIRNRALAVAGRDRVFAEQLIQSGARQLGRQEEQQRYATLASQAIKAGETEAATKYITQSFEADPTLINASLNILELAAKDRAAADRLIIQYVERLRAIPLSLRDQSAFRTYSHLYNLVFPNPSPAREGGQIRPTGPAAMRTYISYVIESMGRLEQSDPGSARTFRHFLVSTWLPLKEYAPELTGAFMELERLSRRPGEEASLPTRQSVREENKDAYEKRVEEALKGGQPDEFLIRAALSRGDFDGARKMIDKLPGGVQKTQLIESANMKEALALAAKGDTINAERMGEQLTKAPSVLEVYSALINRCAAAKDQACVARLTRQAMNQLRRADPQPFTPPQGAPVPVLSNREMDSVLLSLSHLAVQVAPASDALALELLDEIVEAANRSEMDTAQGRTGFDAAVFKSLAAKNEPRARQAAEGLKDRLRRIVALAAVDQVKAEELSKTAEGPNKKKPGGGAGGDSKPRP